MAAAIRRLKHLERVSMFENTSDVARHGLDGLQRPCRTINAMQRMPLRGVHDPFHVPSKGRQSDLATPKSVESTIATSKARSSVMWPSSLLLVRVRVRVRVEGEGEGEGGVEELIMFGEASRLQILCGSCRGRSLRR